MTKRTLSERQIRWKSILDVLPGIKLRYRPGKEAGRPDALSRLEQDTPKDPNDPRLRHRDMKLINESWISLTEHKIPAEITEKYENLPFEDNELNRMWYEGIEKDGEFRDIRRALLDDKPCFPPSVQTKISISECSIDEKGCVRWRDRLLVPQYEPLQTELIHRSHDSPTTGHPGREVTLSILSRDFYWPRMSQMVRQFIRNCDVCGRTHVWRDKKRGFLKPLPIPNRFYQELSIDFMTDLPGEKDQPRFLMVITDRLSKEIILEAMTTMTAEACAIRFLHCFYRFHGFPRAIVSDRGSNWVGDFWRRLCNRVAANDPLPSQKQDDYQPEPINVTAPRQEQEFTIERILRAENRRRGRGYKKMLLVKWQGQKEPTWEPRSEFEDTIALDDFEQKYGLKDNVGDETFKTVRVRHRLQRRG
ncbi:unnamed protein product [Trifolium pratense]|uniref:Uncharacterized protein n=1 Tax=Trifolium pratense TaxID=57577 RepID=A0ACB0KZ09_TRIPR|nr:unnamed protein product [Trifolium pratense]